MMKRALSILTMTIVSSLAVAKSVYITGTIQTVEPTFSSTIPSPILRGVKSYNFVGSQSGGQAGCTITTDISQAQQSTLDNRYCYFEWLSDTDNGGGWNNSGFNTSGRALAPAGNHTRSYQISFFSGSSKEKVIVGGGDINYTTVDPVPPVITNIVTTTSTGTYSGLNHITHNKNEKLKNVKVHVEARNYPQIIRVPSLANAQCTVPENNTSCNISNVTLEISSNDALTGNLPIAFSVADPYNFMTNADTINFAWDYRPPVIEQYVVNAKSNQAHQNSPKSINVGGHNVTVGNDEAVIVVSSPHKAAYSSNFWWLPPTLEVKFTKDEDHVIDMSYVTLDGENIGKLFKNDFVNYTDRTMLSDGTYEQYGNKYVYRVNIANVKDGIYKGEIVAKDTFNNSSTLSHDSSVIDRLPPEIHVFNIKDKFSNGDPVYFLEHLVMTVQDETSDNNQITAVKLNGNDIDFHGEHDMAKAISDGISLDARTVHALSITGQDMAGNSITRTFTLDFMPLNFRYSDIENQKFALVQEQQISFIQTQGQSCKLYKSEHEAVTAIRNHGQLNCSIEWLSIPDGLEPAWDTPLPELIGAFAYDTDAFINARIWMHDKFGRKNLIKTDDVTLLVSAPDQPEIIFDERGQFDTNKYAVEPGVSKISRFRLRAASSPIRVTVSRNGEVLKESFIRQSNRYAWHNVTQTLIDLEKAYNRRLWEEHEYTVTVRYALMPNIEGSNIAYSYAVPSKRIRMKMANNVRELSTLNELNLSSTFGLYDSFYRRVVYKPETMGDWEIQVVAENRDKTITPLTTLKNISANGEDTYKLNWAADDIGHNRFYTIAKLKSPNPKYVHEVRSNKSAVKVLKGTAINGDLRTMRIAGPAPLSAMIQYVHDSRDDKDAADEVEWFISSNNGQSWTKHGQDGSRFIYRAENEGTWLVKAEVKNRFTGILATTNHVQIMSYQVPDLDIIGATNVISGMTKNYVAMDHGQPADLSDIILQWSIDGGLTFVEDVNNIDYTADEIGNNKLLLRAAYIGFESNPNSWDETILSVRGQPPRPVRTGVHGLKEMETGDVEMLKARVSLPYSNMDSTIVTEWVRPDGSIVQTNELEFAPTLDDLAWADWHDFTLRAWVQDAKAETYNEYKHRVRVWEYQFPEFNLAYKQSIKVAPSVFEVWLRRPIGHNLHEDFEYDWNGNGEVEITRDMGYKARFTAKQPGLYPITVSVKDERGNYQDFIEYIEVLEPEPLSIELVERFSNKYQRAPLNVNMRPQIRGGHPSDRVADYKWYLNGMLQPELDRSTATFEDLPAGVHKLKLAVLTKYGQEEEYEQTVEVIPNKPPTCEIKHNIYSKSARIEAVCDDDDGKMARYHWKVDGVERRNVGKRISEYRELGSSVVVELIGEDDSGDTATATTVVNW
ncbi:Ig-like domain-containing protein (plasmid) [Vibrio sp. SS-MA-C1-2]|uniref:Ig-like domain-containing protein n=1 Tax=Vibrio sp. SS-MA-C1-2 TaxID=2908646 RepID=UPI001F46D867|nr:Ig-like domain-containing protein [Vibrio sp. SS-MA-C1-2]UJF20238.1 Ig-like domain-containing protein [Vibrio sp. SS-MA-C1-2]